MLGWRRASRRMPCTLARRLGWRLPMPLSSTLMLARRVAVCSLPPGPADGPAEAVDRRLVVVLDGLHRRARALQERRGRLLLRRCDRARGRDRAHARHSMATGRHAVVVDGDADAHRLLPGVLLGHLRRQPGDAADDEEELRRRRRKAEVVEHGGQRPVDVDGKGLDPGPGRRLQAQHEGDAVAGEAGLARHVEQDVHARVRACARGARGRARAGRRPPRPRRLEPPPRAIEIDSLAGVLDAGRDHLHAGGAGAAVLVPDGQQPGGDGRGQGPAIAGGGQPRRRARRRARAVIRHRDQHGVQQPALSGAVGSRERWSRNNRSANEARCIKERDVVAADPDVRLVRVRDRRAPGFHERR